MAEKVLLGDEAVAQAAIDSGITGAYAYPGTPSTEILEYIMAWREKYGKPLASWCANEKTAYGPGDVYQRTKLEGDLLVQGAIAEGLPAVIVRPSAIYGPGDDRLLKLFKSVESGLFPMIGNGRPSYHLIHVRDLVNGILVCGSREKAVGNNYILAGDEPTSLRELVRRIAVALDRPLRTIRIPFWPVYGAAVACEMLCRPVGIEPPLYRRRVDFFRKNRIFDASKARRDLGFSPKIDLKSGLRETAEWYRAHGLL